MNRERIEALMEIVPPGEQEELTVLSGSYFSTLKAYQQDPDYSPDTLKANRAASRALVDLVEALENKYLQGVDQFRSIMDALRYLKDNGWKIEKSRLYNAAKDGLFKVNADKSVDEVQILAYAAGHLEKHKATGADDEAGKLTENKLTGEVELNALRKKKMEFELAKDKGLYIHRAQWLTELVGKLSASRLTALRIARNKAPDLIAAVGGDMKKESVFVELFSSWIEDAFNDLAAAPELRFAVVHQKHDEMEGV